MLLAFLKITDIIEAKNRIIADSTQIIAENPMLTSFFEYFDHEWMADLQKWNIFNTDRRTNNDLEGWHFKLLDRLSKNSRALGFWKFVEMIGEEAVEEQHIVGCLRNGISLGSRKCLRSVTTEANLKRMQKMYADNELNAIQFMRGLMNK